MPFLQGAKVESTIKMKMYNATKDAKGIFQSMVDINQA